MSFFSKKGYSPAPQAIRNRLNPSETTQFNPEVLAFALHQKPDEEHKHSAVISSGSTYHEQASAHQFLRGTIPLVEGLLGSDSLFLKPGMNMRSRVGVEVVTGNPQISNPNRFDPTIPHREHNFPSNHFYATAVLYRPGTIFFIGDYQEKKSKANASGREYVFPNGFETQQHPATVDDRDDWIEFFRLTQHMVHQKPHDVPPTGILIGVSAEFL
jgi:hypothetical protein